MSIISCTSPRPSDTILPVSRVTSAPRSSFAARSSSPSRRTSSPRRGAGTSRHSSNAVCARAIAASVSAADDDAMRAITSPVIGVRTSRSPDCRAARSSPRREKIAAVSMGGIVPRADALPSRTRACGAADLPRAVVRRLRSREGRTAVHRPDDAARAAVRDRAGPAGARPAVDQAARVAADARRLDARADRRASGSRSPTSPARTSPSTSVCRPARSR